ncbi:MAG: ASKHA domain-containing protein [Bryobacteraceae bacterium]
MGPHQVSFAPSGRSTIVADGATVFRAAELAGEPLGAECGGRGACGRCLVRVLEGAVPEYRVLRREDGQAEVLGCLTPVHGPLVVQPLVEMQLPRLISRDTDTGLAPLAAWAPWPLAFDPIVAPVRNGDLGVAVDIGTTTLRLLILRLGDGVIVGEASAYNPQIPRGADVITRIVAAERGALPELAAGIRGAVGTMLNTAAAGAGLDPSRVRAYVAAGNLTMIHLLLAADPSGIRRVPSTPGTLAFAPVLAADLGWPGTDGAAVHTLPAAGGWVGGDIVAGAVRAGFSRGAAGPGLYVDLGTNGEILCGGADFALAGACSAGPAFEGGGIRCGMRADRGAIDGARVDAENGRVELSVIGGGQPRGLCGSGLIALTDELFRVGWVDRGGRFTARLPGHLRAAGRWGAALALTPSGKVTLWERDIESLIRAKAAVLAGIRTLTGSLGADALPIERVVVSGNFGRFLNLPAAQGIGLLPALAPGRFGYVANGALEGAALALLSREFGSEVEAYLRRITYVDLSDLPGYMDEFVGASFLPHTSPEMLNLGAAARPF